LTKELENIQSSISALKAREVEIPQSLFNKEAELKGKLNPNKYNAQKIEYRGAIYDSTWEAKCAEMLDVYADKGIISYQRQVPFLLQEGFSLRGAKIQDIQLTVDFLINDKYIVDAKGSITEEFNLKFKMLKFRYRERYEYFTVIKKSEVDKIISMIIVNSQTLNL